VTEARDRDRSADPAQASTSEADQGIGSCRGLPTCDRICQLRFKCATDPGQYDAPANCLDVCDASVPGCF